MLCLCPSSCVKLALISVALHRWAALDLDVYVERTQGSACGFSNGRGNLLTLDLTGDLNDKQLFVDGRLFSLFLQLL